MREYHGLSDEEHGLVVWVSEHDEDGGPTKVYELERWDASERWDHKNLAYSILSHFLGYPPRNQLLEEFSRRAIPKESVWDLPDTEVATWLVTHHWLAFGK